MATLKTFEVTFSSEFIGNDSSLIMDVSGYSHIKFESKRRVYGGGHYYTVETAFVRATSLTALRAELKRVFGYRFEKYLYNSIKPFQATYKGMSYGA